MNYAMFCLIQVMSEAAGIRRTSFAWLNCFCSLSKHGFLETPVSEFGKTFACCTSR